MEENAILSDRDKQQNTQERSQNIERLQSEQHGDEEGGRRLSVTAPVDGCLPAPRLRRRRIGLVKSLFSRRHVGGPL
ncbi:hypothetical protein, partial [Rhodoblastus acidophilus]|uniref:hypothetical protein n=1 Tax=Rhodoblastus acidophilus TaxID=1074 RepID=UPI003CD011A4